MSNPTRSALNISCTFAVFCLGGLMSEDWEKINKRLAEFEGGFCTCDSYGTYTAYPGICGQCGQPRRPQYDRDFTAVLRVIRLLFPAWEFCIHLWKDGTVTVEYRHIESGGLRTTISELETTEPSKALTLACYRAIEEGR